MQDIVADFNSTLITLLTNLATVCPNSIIGTNINTIVKTVNNKQYPTKFIEMFCIKVLKYKEEIDAGNDDFFLKKDFKEDMTDSDISIDIVPSIKALWKDLKAENRKISVYTLQILCALAQEYFIYTFSH
jgi:hypothetical protein